MKSCVTCVGKQKFPKLKFKIANINLRRKIRQIFVLFYHAVAMACSKEI